MLFEREDCEPEFIDRLIDNVDELYVLEPFFVRMAIRKYPSIPTKKAIRMIINNVYYIPCIPRNPHVYNGKK